MALTIANCQSVTKIDWRQIDTVLLDMDGTLLDLQFDNVFWLETIPETLASHRGISVAEATAQLAPIFEREAGKLNWYCLDFWSQELGFSVADVKRTVAEGVDWRPEAQAFLERLKASHCDVVLITNAHPDTLAIKLEQIDLSPWFDRMFTSHQFAAPKESPLFWSGLMAAHPFSPDRTLFIDDSEAVLAAAEKFGVEHLITLRQPDSSKPLRSATRYPAIHHFDEIYGGIPRHD